MSKTAMTEQEMKAYNDGVRFGATFMGIFTIVVLSAILLVLVLGKIKL